MNFVIEETTDGFNPCCRIKDLDGNDYGIWKDVDIFQRFAEAVGLSRLKLWNERREM